MMSDVVKDKNGIGKEIDKEEKKNIYIYIYESLYRNIGIKSNCYCTLCWVDEVQNEYYHN